MRFPRPLLPAAAVAVAAMVAGCTSPADPDPSPSASAEATTLEEVAEAVVAEGLVHRATLEVVTTIEGSQRLSVVLGGLDESTPTELAAVLDDVRARVDAVLADAPSTTHVELSTTRDDGLVAAVDLEVDLGRDVLVELLTIATETACHGVRTSAYDRYGYAEGSGESVTFAMTRATLECSVDASSAVEVASAYDEITAIAPTSTLVDDTRWRVEALDPDADAAELLIDVAPVDGRQELYVERMTIAEDGGLERPTIEDSGDRVDVSGFADAAQAAACDALWQRLATEPDLTTRTVAITDLAMAEDHASLCFLQA